MKKRLLYVGNKLSKHGNTATSVETLGAFLEQEGYTVYYASSIKNKVFRLLHMIFATLYYSKKVDYVMIDTYSTQNFWFAYIVSQLCRWTKVPYIAKLHGGDLPRRLKKSTKRCNQLFKNARFITAPSNYLYESFLPYYPENLLLIPNSIDLEKYPFQLRSVSGPRLLWVRSFSKIYNPKMAIDVYALLKKDFPNAELCMIGPDKENSIEKYIKYSQDLGLDVTFTGKLSKEEWIARAADFDVFINTTHFDNTPVSVIEAMALGLPVVSTNVGGIPFLIENRKQGLLVEDSDTLGMVNAIRQLLNDPHLVLTIQKNARAKVAHYDWQVIKNFWVALLS
jgi:glycosyltransferase involved in cell wall biosynthesis